jgi:pyruvate formate lyase activating enzyme
VLVPGLTDAPANLAGMAEFVATLRTVERVEVLPFHQMGRYKWERLGLPYTLSETAEPDEALLERARDYFRQHGLHVM